VRPPASRRCGSSKPPGSSAGWPPWSVRRPAARTCTRRAAGQGNGSLRGQHIDFRSVGGYVLAPPSAVGGRPYVVVSHQAHGDPIDWAKVREHLEPQRERQWEPGAAGLMHRFWGSVAGPMAPK
jgi:Bifunctional DNA primase/polymerase, N-terminal